MTRTRLIEALTANNPADVALQEVITACHRTLAAIENGVADTYYSLRCVAKQKKGKCLINGEPDCCLLAHAWSKPFKSISVGTSVYEFFQKKNGRNIYDGGKQHPYSDVVYWFDSFGSQKQAAETVLALLNGELQEA